jgi:hypothetical protein
VAPPVSQVRRHNLAMKFIHTADWQIGMKAVHAGNAAEAVRAARMDAATRVCRLAEDEHVDFLLLAGDTFEDNAVDRATVERVGALLGGTRCAAFVLPGNHDPVQPGSVWDHPVWKSAANVTVLRESVPVPAPGGAVLLPCPLRTRRSDEDPTSWIPAGSEGGVRVIVAHGNVTGITAEEGGFPIPMDLAARTGADYVALGHWHSTVLFSARMAYSGTHEPTRFGELDSGNALLVSIPEPGAEPVIESRKTAQLRWLRIGAGETITTPGKLAEIARTVSGVPDQDRTLVDVTLAGLLFERDREEIGRIENACSRFLAHRLDWSALRPAPGDHDWIGRLPGGSVQIAADRLRQASEGDSEETRVAMQALLELYAFAQEVRR